MKIPITKTYSLITIFLLLISILPSHAQEPCESAIGGIPLVLGAIFPQDVLLLSDTSEWWRGTETMTAAINACGGVNGRPVEYRYEEAATYEEALTAFDRLAAEGVPLIVASGFAPVNEGLMQKAEEAGIVLWEVTERPAETSNEWTFYAHPNENEVGAELAAYIQASLLPQLGITEPHLALVYEERPRAAAIAAGLRDSLEFAPMIDEAYENDLNNAYSIAVNMRENEVNILIVISFQNDADRLWNAMLQANTNVDAWLHLGGADYQNGLESRLGNTNGMLLVGANGVLLDAFPSWIDAGVNEFYQDEYQNVYGEAPNQESNLSASGIYTLLRQLLPRLNYENITADSIHELMAATPRGSWWDTTEAALYVRQNQDGNFCAIAPNAYATCPQALQAFPTWRERVRDN